MFLVSTAFPSRAPSIEVYAHALDAITSMNDSIGRGFPCMVRELADLDAFVSWHPDVGYTYGLAYEF